MVISVQKMVVDYVNYNHQSITMLSILSRIPSLILLSFIKDHLLGTRDWSNPDSLVANPEVG